MGWQTRASGLVFVNKVLLRHSHVHSFNIGCGCAHATPTQLGRCDRHDRMTCKT